MVDINTKRNQTDIIFEEDTNQEASEEIYVLGVRNDKEINARMTRDKKGNLLTINILY